VIWQPWRLIEASALLKSSSHCGSLADDTGISSVTKISPGATFLIVESPHPATKNVRIKINDFAIGLVMLLMLSLIMFTVLLYLGNVGEGPSAIE
jgi:hypothetical protein